MRKKKNKIISVQPSLLCGLYRHMYHELEFKRPSMIIENHHLHCSTFTITLEILFGQIIAFSI